MPDGQSATTTVTYTAASIIAAVTLTYVLGPSVFVSHDAVFPSKRGAVGLSNPANDCFINAVLQALAGSEELRTWLRTETEWSHSTSEPLNKEMCIDILQHNAPYVKLYRKSKLVTEAVAGVLVKLSQESAHRKTVSAAHFVRNLEASFGSRLNRRQQDAHELLQITLDRLRDEHQARSSLHVILENDKQHLALDNSRVPPPASYASSDERMLSPTCFPFEGVLESQIECLTCHYTPKSSMSSFVVLTLNVPQQVSASIDECFDTLLKQETIEDFKCDMCRLATAKQVKLQEINRASAERKHSLEVEIHQLNESLEHGPETLSHEVILPPSNLSPKRRINRNLRLARYPRILAVHLSRSVFDISHRSSKNTAKVSFKESLMLGGFDRQRYKLACVVAHLGRHDSGHYETYRRQAPSANSDADVQLAPERSKSTTDREQGLLGARDDHEKTNRSRALKSPKKRDTLDKWWRLSDENVSECRTIDVLALQSQVYLLIFEKVG